MQISNGIITFVPLVETGSSVILLDMKTRELVKLLKLNGCYFVKHGKKHDRWYSPITNSKFSVPRHDSQEVPEGTLNSILMQAGVK